MRVSACNLKDRINACVLIILRFNLDSRLAFINTDTPQHFHFEVVLVVLTPCIVAYGAFLTYIRTGRLPHHQCHITGSRGVIAWCALTGLNTYMYFTGVNSSYNLENICSISCSSHRASLVP